MLFRSHDASDVKGPAAVTAGPDTEERLQEIERRLQVLEQAAMDRARQTQQIAGQVNRLADFLTKFGEEVVRQQTLVCARLGIPLKRLEWFTKILQGLKNGSI